jgi:hypothetical protein
MAQVAALQAQLASKSTIRMKVSGKMRSRSMGWVASQSPFTQANGKPCSLIARLSRTSSRSTSTSFRGSDHSEIGASNRPFFAAIHCLVLELLAKAPRGRASPMFLAQFTAELLDLVRNGLATVWPETVRARGRTAEVARTGYGRRPEGDRTLGRIRMSIEYRRLAHVTNQLDLRGASHKKARIRSSDSQM